MNTKKTPLFEEAVDLIQKDKKRIKKGSNEPTIDEFTEIMKQMEILQKKIDKKQSSEKTL